MEFSNRTKICIVCVVGLWLQLILAHILFILPAFVYLLVGPAIALSAFAIFVRFEILFWLPLISMINWMILSLITWWGPPLDLAQGIMVGVFSLVALVVYTVSRTRRLHEKRQTRDGVLYSGLVYSSLAGFFIGIMITVPFAVVVIATAFPFFNLRAALILIAMPGVAGMIGFAIGIPLSFVCDIAVGMDVRHHRRTRKPMKPVDPPIDPFTGQQSPPEQTTKSFRQRLASFVGRDEDDLMDSDA